jgi:hypothetical protein
MNIVGWLVALTGLLTLAACGGDDDVPKGAAGGAGRAEAGSVGGAPGGKQVICGGTTCKQPMSSALEPCCIDEFAGTCGTSNAGRCQPLPSESADDCPFPDGIGFGTSTAGSKPDSGATTCCAKNDQCGIDLGVGLGCTAFADLCVMLAPQSIAKLSFSNCAGEPIDEPENCRRIRSGE